MGEIRELKGFAENLEAILGRLALGGTVVVLSKSGAAINNQADQLFELLKHRGAVYHTMTRRFYFNGGSVFFVTDTEQTRGLNIDILVTEE